jgi:catechol 2,3-dioxygenase-like lactoylglutathione lyase family enzyme
MSLMLAECLGFHHTRCIRLECACLEQEIAMSKFSIQHIDHIVLRVTDLERSIRFYQAVLGCTLVKRREDLGMVHLRAGASMIDLVDVEGPLGRAGGPAASSERRNVDHFCLRIEPFDEQAILSHLAGHGLEADRAVRRFGADGMGLSIYCKDPDGNQLELKGPASAD